MLKIKGEGTNTRVVHNEPALPASTKVPHTREAVERLGDLQRMCIDGTMSILRDGEIITRDDCFDVLRRFVLMR